MQVISHNHPDRELITPIVAALRWTMDNRTGSATPNPTAEYPKLSFYRDGARLIVCQCAPLTRSTELKDASFAMTRAAESPARIADEIQRKLLNAAYYDTVARGLAAVAERQDATEKANAIALELCAITNARPPARFDEHHTEQTIFFTRKDLHGQARITAAHPPIVRLTIDLDPPKAKDALAALFPEALQPA